jgi:hypothetical protein
MTSETTPTTPTTTSSTRSAPGTLSPSVAERIAPLQAELAALQAHEAALSRQRAAVAAVATFQLGVRQRALRCALAAVDAQLEAARAALPAAAPAKPAKPAKQSSSSNGPRAPQRQADAGAPTPQPWKSSPSYMFWSEYKKLYGKVDPATQKELTALCGANGIDQKAWFADRSADALARAHSIRTGK